MAIQVDNSVKIRLAKWGPNKLFGDEVDARQKTMGPDKLISLFDNVWESVLKVAVETAEIVNAADARERLNDNEKRFFDFNQDHREFRLPDKNIEFIAQIRPIPNDDRELTQLWVIYSLDNNPKVLRITFDTVEERRNFARLAKALKWNDVDLGKSLVLDFMAKFPKDFSEE